MKFRGIAVLAAICAGSGVVWAQETNDVEQMRRQLRELQENYQRSQAEQKARMEELQKQVEALSGAKPAQKGQDLVPSTSSGSVAGNTPPSEVSPVTNWKPSDPIRLQNGRAYMDVGLVGTFAVGGSTTDDIEGSLELGGHDPNQRGFTVQGLEAAFSGAVDPYFQAQANILFSVDAEGESFVELEEAWMETLSLPAGLQLRAGEILTEFGRQNPQHPHQWMYVDTPLVLGRYFGPDGLRNPGARLSWLMPFSFFSQLSLTVQDSQGETASSYRYNGGSHGGEEETVLPFSYRQANNDRGVGGVVDMLITTRYAVSFDLSETQTLLAGASAAFGPNSRGDQSAGDTTTEIYGVDLTWKWRPERHHGGFPFVQLQAEGLLRSYDAGSFNWDLNGNGITDNGELADAGGTPANFVGETLVDYGCYAQVQYGFRKGWVAGLRADYVTSDPAAYESGSYTFNGEAVSSRDPARAQRWRLSPNLTWYPTEFSKIRLQYNYDDRDLYGVDHSVWLQFEFVLGAHAAHVF